MWNKKYDGSAEAHVGMTRLAMALQQQPQYYQGFFFGIAINAIFDSNVRGETQGFLVDEKILIMLVLRIFHSNFMILFIEHFRLCSL